MSRPWLAAALLVAAACSRTAPLVSNGGDAGATTPLYPLALGARWSFKVQALGVGGQCNSGMFDQTVLSANGAGARPAFQLTSFCTGAPGTSDLSTPGGDEVDIWEQSTWAPLIALPLQEGWTWAYLTTTYAWHRETAVTVPAGSFTDCWTARHQTVSFAYETYCRGVGPVASHFEDETGAGWDAQLVTATP